MKILVLGAGIVGTTTAYYLARDGHQVEVIDRQDKAAMETSFSNAGMIAPGHSYTWASPRAPKILWESLFRDDTALRWHLKPDLQLWRWGLKFLRECSAERSAVNTAHKARLCLYSKQQFVDVNQSLSLEYHRTVRGGIYLYREADHFQRGVAAMKILTDNGVELRVLDPDQAVEIEPALASEKSRLAGAIYCPMDESGDCHKFSNRLAEHCAASMGVSFHWNTTVSRIERAGDRVDRVLTDKGPRTADAYVLALGSYSPLFNRDLGLALPIYPVKGYAMTIPIGGRNGAPSVPGVDEKYLIGWSRLGDRLRVTATADFAGYDRSHSERDFAHILATVQALFPDGADYARAERWAGLRPMTPKGTPIIGASPLRNLWLNTGHGHIGWTMSMGSAAILADLVAARRPAIDLAGLGLADA